MLASHVRRVCGQTSYRFPVDKYNWPPEQPKDFTPVVLIHYQDQYDTTKSPHIVYPVGEEFTLCMLLQIVKLMTPC